MNKIIILVCLLLFTPINVCKCYSENNINESLNDLLQANEKIAYAALISLNEKCQHVFPEYETYRPEDLFDRLSKKEKNKIIDIINSYTNKLGNRDKEYFFERVDKWILSYNQIKIFFNLKSEEETISAFYYLFPNEKIFISILENRKVNPEDGDVADFIGATVSSAEIDNIQYVLLNKLSLLSENDLIIKFKSIFEYFLK